MTVTVETVNEDRKQTLWQTIKQWLTALDEGMNYDPNEYSNTMVRHLAGKVEQLETRVTEIENTKSTI